MLFIFTRLHSIWRRVCTRRPVLQKVCVLGHHQDAAPLLMCAPPDEWATPSQAAPPKEPTEVEKASKDAEDEAQAAADAARDAAANAMKALEKASDVCCFYMPVLPWVASWLTVGSR